MSLKSKTLSSAITFALVMSANAALGTGVAYAQDQADTKQAEQDKASLLEAVQVTGSRIQNQAITASSPVVEIQAEAFQYAGATRVEDLVNQYPQLSPTFDSFQNNGATGYPTIDLRGLGPTRTLTLIDGFRMPQGAGFATDISIVPASLVKRVDILTGGASAVYGSDAVAGVVNFLLDTEFEGVSINIGTSAYRHDNSTKFIQELQARRGFNVPKGDSGFDGVSENIDIAVGSSFADGRGHAMAWATWRKNEALFQGERDYSACALNASATACGGSNTNAAGNFYVYQPGSNPPDTAVGSQASIGPNGRFLPTYGAPYNFAPINYFQRPDERYTFGSSVKFEVNEHFKPYLETMYINRRSAIQVAESGAFFTPVATDCADPLVRTLCADLGVDPANGPLSVYVAKRNVEGGPRHFAQDDENFRIVTGAEGEINSNWSYNASFVYGRSTSTIIGTGDFLSDRIVSAIRGCPAGSFDGCLPYTVFNGSVTPEAAAAIQGTSLNNTTTALTEINAYVTGDLGFGLPSAKGETISLVVGTDWREDKYDFTADSNSQAGNFAGAGGPALPLSGRVRVKEGFMEAQVPLLKDVGMLKNLGLDLGYRYSDYNLAGTANTYKIGFGADLDKVKLRGGFNRAIRAPNTANLFATRQINLFGGTDPCAGAVPIFTQEQCANTGVSAARYGFIPANAAGQYNQFTGGTLDLSPEKADTWTAGFVVNPTANTYVNVDWFHIKITDTIRGIGAQAILDGCGLTGDDFLCSLVKRSNAGDLFRGSDPDTSGFVENFTGNFGDRITSGIDLGAGYNFNALGGRFDVSLQGSYVIEDSISPLAGVNNSIADRVADDCAGRINFECQTPEWRHVATIRYSRDIWSVGARWRYFGSMDYEGNQGEELFVDKQLCRFDESQPARIPAPTPANPNRTVANPKFGCTNDGNLGARNYFDLNASISIGEYGELTFGVNNVLDSRPPIVGNTLALNGNSPGGYDQAGRYFFSNFSLKF